MEDAFGQLKMMFKILGSKFKNRDIATIQTISVACMVVYNTRKIYSGNMSYPTAEEKEAYIEAIKELDLETSNPLEDIYNNYFLKRREEKRQQVQVVIPSTSTAAPSSSDQEVVSTPIIQSKAMLNATSASSTIPPKQQKRTASLDSKTPSIKRDRKTPKTSSIIAVSEMPSPEMVSPAPSSPPEDEAVESLYFNEVNEEGENGVNFLNKFAPVLKSKHYGSESDETDADDMKPSYEPANKVTSSIIRGTKQEIFEKEPNTSTSTSANQKEVLALSQPKKRQQETETEEDIADVEMVTIFEIVEEEELIYCFCKEGERGNMIQCEVCNEWFHYECVNIKRKPRGSWYCTKQCIQRSLKQKD